MAKNTRATSRQEWEKALQGTPSSVDKHFRRVPQELREVVYKCLRKVLRHLPRRRNARYLLFALAREVRISESFARPEPSEVLADPSYRLMLLMYRDGVHNLIPDENVRREWNDNEGLLVELYDAMTSVKHNDNFAVALRRAQALPVTFRSQAIQANTKLALVANIAFHLHQMQAETRRSTRVVIFLPVEIIGRALGRKTMQSAANLGSSIVNTLLDLGVIETCREEYSYRDGRAKSYFFKSDAVNE